LYKGQKGKKSPQNRLPDAAIAKLSSPGTLSTRRRVTELEMGREKVRRGCPAL